jgi:glutaminyl-peptide cyclotransferase
LLQPEDRAGHYVDVLNGIAYDESHRRLYVTGKLWPTVYEIGLVPQ